MNNKTKEFFADEAEDMKIGTEEIILDAENNIFDEAKEISHETGADRKYPFTFKYDANRKDFLVSVINTVGATIESDYDTNILRACMNMKQLELIKSLDCVERVISNKIILR